MGTVCTWEVDLTKVQQQQQQQLQQQGFRNLAGCFDSPVTLLSSLSHSS